MSRIPYYGNQLGPMMMDRRSDNARDIAKRFGAAVLVRHPGMGDYMSRTLFGSSGHENQIQWTLAEMQKLAASTSNIGDSNSILNGVGGGARWPIAPTYDYLLTLDQVVSDILSEIERLKSFPQLSAGEQHGLRERMIHPDFRPWWFHEGGIPFGAVDKNGLVLTEGQALGSTMKIANDKLQTRSPYELACDAALLYRYPHIHNIIALSQGLYKVFFTKCGLLTTANDGNVSATANDGAWVNAFEAWTPPGGLDADMFKITPMMHIAAQETDLKQYDENHFFKGKANNGLTAYSTTLASFTPTGAAPMYTKVLEGGAMASLWTYGGSIPAQAPDGEAWEVNVDHFRSAAQALAGKHPIGFITLFRDIAQSLGIDLALRSLHMNAQVLFAEVTQLNSRKTYNVTDMHAMVNQSSCPPNATRVYVDRKGRYAPPTIMTPDGPVRNPAIVGIGGCRTLVQDHNDPAFFRSVTARNWGLGNESQLVSGGEYPFAAEARRRSSSRKGSSSRKRSSSRKTGRSRSRGRARAVTTFSASARKRSSSRKKGRSRSRSRSRGRARAVTSYYSAAANTRKTRTFSFGASARTRKHSKKKKGTRARSRSRSRR